MGKMKIIMRTWELRDGLKVLNGLGFEMSPMSCRVWILLVSEICRASVANIL